MIRLLIINLETGNSNFFSGVHVFNLFYFHLVFTSVERLTKNFRD
jgi:hypothetical protein